MYNNMNKAELAAVIAEKCGVTKKQAEDGTTPPNELRLVTLLPSWGWQLITLDMTLNGDTISGTYTSENPSDNGTISLSFQELNFDDSRSISMDYDEVPCNFDHYFK